MKKITSLTPSTGGVLNPDQVIGRNLNVQELIIILRRQSVNLSAFRRSGKSSLLAKLHKELKKSTEFVSIYLDVEGIKTCDSFIEKLYHKFKDEKIIKDSAIKKIDTAFDKLLGRFSNIKLPGGFSANINERRQVWEKQLDELLKEIIKANPDKLIVISLDEFSIMLDKIEDEGEASELVGILRAIMHNEPFRKTIRFIYCGSIGIDLVLDKLKKAGNNIGQPLNTMYDYILEPLTDEDAFYLAQCFDKGCNLKLHEDDMKFICELSENIPYYIDFIFSLIRHKFLPISSSIINEAYSGMLNDSKDKAEFKHFYERITLHYPEKEISFHILNFLSKDKSPKTEKEILNHVSAQKEINRQSLIDELDRLRTDDYLSRSLENEERTYQFKYEILRMWWKLNKSY